MSKKRFNNYVYDVAFMGPALAGFFLTVALPFLISFRYSMMDWNGISKDVIWVGFDNFIKVLKDKQFMESFFYTLKFTGIAVVASNSVGFFLALMLSSKIKCKNGLRVVFFLPNIVSGLILGYIWQFIFINVFSTLGDITNIGFFALPWLGTHNTSLFATVIVYTWQQAGYLMLIYIAGLANIPGELIESAKIDGAGSFQILKNIRLPLIVPSITVCLFMAISSAFKIFDLNYSLTKGAFDTRSVALEIYNETFLNFNYGYGTAKALIFFVCVAIITLVQTYLTNRKEVEM